MEEFEYEEGGRSVVVGRVFILFCSFSFPFKNIGKKTIFESFNFNEENKN